MEKGDIGIEILDNTLTVNGEKCFERDNTQGRWRVVQCAYGRGASAGVVPLPAPVLAGKARASYGNGLLRVELPKAAPCKPKSITVKVDGRMTAFG